ncbi:MAG: paraquat-inducible protein A [Proteobacteria bacterium]|nr:paraquat-inducible protein A [Pseudomonadota bacterium]
MMVRYKFDAALLALALPLLVAGLLLPAVSVSSLWIFNDTFSLTDGALQLLREGEYLLFVAVFFFTFVFPVLKIVAGLAVCLGSPGNSRLFRRLFPAMAALSKWSMLDVFVVAIIVVMLEGSLLSDADARFGLFLFAGSVVLSTLAIQRLKSRI